MSNLLTIRGLKIDGLEDEQWKPIVKGVDLRPLGVHLMTGPTLSAQVYARVWMCVPP